jgi:hypothetical protein
MNLSKILAVITMTATITSAGWAADEHKDEKGDKGKEKVELKDLPGPVKERIEKESKGFELIHIKKETDAKGKTVYVAKIKTNDGMEDVTVNEEGKTVETKKEEKPKDK